MNHPEPTVKLAHQILARIRADLSEPADPQKLAAAIGREYTEMLDTWTSVESDLNAQATGLVLTALMIASDIALYMADVAAHATDIAAQLGDYADAFLVSIKADQLDVMTTGNVEAAWEAFQGWKDLAGAGRIQEPGGDDPAASTGDL